MLGAARLTVAARVTICGKTVAAATAPALKAPVFRNCRRDIGAGVFGAEEVAVMSVEMLQRMLLQ